MEQLRFGISSMNLGAAVEKKPSPEVKISDWENAVKISKFYRAGGHFLPASDTECCFLWDAEALYVLFLCKEKKRTDSEKLVQDKDRIRLKRKECVEIALQSGIFGHRDFSVFTVENTGVAKAVTQRGMTYLGGDKGYLGGCDRIENQAEITEITQDMYTCKTKTIENGWMAFLALPWQLFGGRPEKQFALQVYRKKHQTSEISTPFPLDMQVNFSDRFEYDPLTFLEVFLNGEKGVSSEKEVLCTLPDGVKRWQRPVKLVWPSEEERREIEELHHTKEATTLANMADRIRLLQRWQDVLTLEGMDYFTGQSVANSWEFREPWVERRLCNEAFLKGDIDAVCKELDIAIAYFVQLTEWWYTDHTLGNRSNAWTTFGRLEKVSKEDQEVCMTFADGQQLYLAAGAGGFRFHKAQKGFFDAKKEELKLSRQEDFWVAESVYGKIRITPGLLWKIHLEGTDFEIRSDQLKIYYEKKDEIAGAEWDLRLNREDGVYGFGECFDAVNQRGKIRSLWQRDACEGCLASIGNQSYKNIPLAHISSGYSVFINSHYRIRADIANETTDLLRFHVSGPVVDFFIWRGRPEQTMNGYTQLTGRPILPPKWVFEPWAGGGAGRWYHGPLHDVCKEQMAVLEQFEELDIPHSGIYAEGAGAHWFKNPKSEELYKIVAFAEKKGIRAFSWQYPDMSMEEARGYLPDIEPEDIPINKIAPHEGNKKLPTYIDFTHPKGMDLLRAQWKVRLDAGIRGTMVDFGDFVPDEAQFYDGRCGDQMHNGYAYEYAKSYRKLFCERYGEDHVLYTRGAAPGSQAFACQFGGDHLTSFLGMTYALHGGITAAASGLPFWGVDVTGYDGFSDEETYLRWTEWAVFCPIMRYHGTEPREPWEYSPETVQIYKRYAWLRENILPYSYGLAIQAHETGMPMMRTMAMEFPGHPELIGCEDSYMYGPDLLVAPVHTEGEHRNVIFPEGNWVDFWDNTNVIEGGKELEIFAPLDRIPVYLREGTFLPLELNGSLHLGESMTTSRKKALLITPSETQRMGTWHRDRTDRIGYCMVPQKDGFYMRCQGTGEWTYLIIKGLKDKPVGITVNHREYQQCLAKTALYFEEGWVVQDDGTVIIRIYDYSEIELSVKM